MLFATRLDDAIGMDEEIERLMAQANQAEEAEEKLFGDAESPGRLPRELANGALKSVLGVRQFLMRGLKDVKTEWLWVCTAFNLRKLIGVLRAGPAAAGL